jgi:SAM-dependent methyltransferase
VSAPNRPLDLDDLRTPAFAGILAELDALLKRNPQCYLHPSKRWEYPWALGRAGLGRGCCVLDAGCGGSIFPLYLAQAGHWVSACDLRLPGRLDRLAGLQAGYVEGDLNALPYSDASFDAVFCISVIEHLPRAAMPGALQELRRVLRPQGRLLLTTDYYERADAELWYEGPGEPFRVDWGFFDKTTLREIVLEAPGLRVEGPLDLDVDWSAMRPRMRDFHGYPYTAMGVALRRTD